MKTENQEQDKDTSRQSWRQEQTSAQGKGQGHLCMWRPSIFGKSFKEKIFHENDNY